MRYKSIKLIINKHYFTIGGGWTLVVGINSQSHLHLQGGSVGTRCRGGDVCVVHRTNGVIPARKLDDRIIRALADDEGLFCLLIKI